MPYGTLTAILIPHQGLSLRRLHERNPGIVEGLHLRTGTYQVYLIQAVISVHNNSFS